MGYMKKINKLPDNAKDIPGYERQYAITPKGTVISYPCKKFNSFRVHKPRLHNHGYLRVQLNYRDFYIHRLVAMVFIPNNNSKIEINHIDGNKKNNSVENLQWVTRSENNKHAFQIGLRDYNELSDMGKIGGITHRSITMNKANKIRKLWKTGKYFQKEIAEMFNISRSSISLIVINRTYREDYSGKEAKKI